MKIIILHDADARIEILNVADNLIKEDIEMFLCEHGYSVNNIPGWLPTLTMFQSLFMSMEQ